VRNHAPRTRRKQQHPFFNFRIFIPIVTILAAFAASGIGWQPTSRAAAFTAGNIVVYRVGDGSAATLVNTGNPVFVDEYTTAGTLVQSIALPTTVSGAQKQLVASGTATSEGFLTRSVDGRYIFLTGYAATPPAANLPTTTSATVNRTVGRIDTTGAVDTSTALTDFASASNPRSVASVNGSTFWVSGGAGGVRYVSALGNITSTDLTSTAASGTFANVRQTNIFGGQLYASSGSGTNTFRGVETVGTGLPTSGAQTVTRLTGLTDTNCPSTYGFFFADLSMSVAGVDTLYIADDDAGALTKFSLVGGVWTSNGTIGVSADDYRGLTGMVVGTTVTLYAARKGGSGTTGGGELVRLTDSSGYNGAFVGTPTLLATAATRTAFRGVALAPALQPDLTVSVNAPANGFVGIPYNYMVTAANGGSADATGVKVQFTLPFGVTYNNATGTNGFTCMESSGVVTCTGGSIMSGNNGTITVNVTPTATGLVTAPSGAAVVDPDNTIVELNDATTNNSSPAAVTTNIMTCPAITLMPPTLADGTQGTPYNAMLTASGGSGSYTFAVTAGSLPNNLNLSPAGGLTGTPVVSETFNFTITATDTMTGCTGSQMYSLFICALPSITMDPANATGAVGDTVSFSAAATGSPTLVYQWFKGMMGLTNGGNISGADTPMLTLTNITAGDAGSYSLKVMNGCDMAQSNPATLTIITPTSDLIISEFRLRGNSTAETILQESLEAITIPADPAQDEYIEFYNTTASPLTVAASDGSAGWSLVKFDGSQAVVFTIPNGTMIPANGHYLIANSNGYTLAAAASADSTYATDIADGAGLALFKTSNPGSFNLGNRLDAAGFSGVADALFREGVGLTPANGITTASEHCFYRKLNSSTPLDSGNNATDFQLVSVNAATLNGAPSILGAPGPENSASPIQHNATIAASLLDPSASANTAPNRGRSTTPITNGSFGTITFRQRFTNNTGQAVTKLRFRIIDMTTLGNVAGSQADLRLLTSNDVTIIVGGMPVPVKGLTLDLASLLPSGGGLNATASAGTITVGTPLANGAQIAVQFRCGVNNGTGTYRFFVNIEALP